MQLVDTLDTSKRKKYGLDIAWQKSYYSRFHNYTRDNNLPHKLPPTCQILAVDGSSLYFRHKRFYHFELSSLDPVPNQF
jgi:hypothetical protein